MSATKTTLLSTYIALATALIENLKRSEYTGYSLLVHCALTACSLAVLLLFILAG